MDSLNFSSRIVREYQVLFHLYILNSFYSVFTADTYTRRSAYRHTSSKNTNPKQFV